MFSTTLWGSYYFILHFKDTDTEAEKLPNIIQLVRVEKRYEPGSMA